MDLRELILWFPLKIILSAAIGYSKVLVNEFILKFENLTRVVQRYRLSLTRVARNGDTANKIGTYSLAVLAKHHG
jgi:hypothetical protein